MVRLLCWPHTELQWQSSTQCMAPGSNVLNPQFLSKLLHTLALSPMSYPQLVENVNFTVVAFLIQLCLYFKCILQIERKEQKDGREQGFHFDFFFTLCVHFQAYW